MTVCVHVCKAEIIGDSYGNISLQVPCTFVIVAVPKPVLRSWENGVAHKVFKLSLLYEALNLFCE